MLEKSDYGPETFAQDVSVSRETLARLKTYAGLLAEWNVRHNLVSRASLDDLWRRHFLDSAQLAAFVPPAARTLVDLGSGAGFPGLVLAVLLRDRPLRVTLYEATAKKCAFLTAVAGRLGLDADIRHGRIEASAAEPFDVVVARALAPLDRLLPYAQRFWGPGTVGLFLKGQNLGAELTKARKSWRMQTREHKSLSAASGVVLEIRELHRVRTPP